MSFLCDLLLGKGEGDKEHEKCAQGREKNTKN